ncbi:hypothetical protein [Microbacterium karelineae]|nr:hypothetical protein [Microbacterium karelineae]
MILAIAFLVLALIGIGATAFALPRDGYGLPRHGIDDWVHRP